MPKVSSQPSPTPPVEIRDTVGNTEEPSIGAPSAGDARSRSGPIPSGSQVAQGWRLLAVMGKALRVLLSIFELLVSLVLVFISPFVFIFLVVTQAKWALSLGFLSTFVYFVARVLQDDTGKVTSAAWDRMSFKVHATILFLVLCLNCMFWGLLLSSLIPTPWMSDFNASAPAWLLDHNWEKWSELFITTIESLVTMVLFELLAYLFELLAYLLAFLPFIFAPALAAGFVIWLFGDRVENRDMFTVYVLLATVFVCVVVTLLFGDSLYWLFWGINGYLLWRGSEWLPLLTLLLIGFMPFRIVAVLRSFSRFRDYLLYAGQSFKGGS